ncbi:MAG: HlyD family secretion protein [Phormidesmis sp.]
MANLQHHDPLEPIETDQFLPPVGRTVTLGSWFIVLVLGSAIAAAFRVSYRTTVKVPAIVRPAGEPRLVQAKAAGTVVDIVADSNTPVAQGALIAQLDTTSLEARAVQLLANLEQGQRRLKQVNAQRQTLEQQMAAEAAQAQRTVAASAADYQQAQRTTLNQSISAEAAVREAETQIELAKREIASFAQLVESGAVSRLQLLEKQAALETAKARMMSLQANLNPSTGNMQAARERIAQAQAGGAATLARLQQAKQQLVQQGLEIQEQLQTTEQEIAQVNLGLQNAEVRSPITGTLHQLNLRNTGQVVTPGETIAQVIPADAPVAIRAMVPAPQINKIEVGMPAQMRVSACPFSEFGVANGTVKSISPDTVTPTAQPNQTGVPSKAAQAFYSVMIETDSQVLEASTGDRTCELQPGTEGRITIISRTETVITFLRRKAGLMTEF